MKVRQAVPEDANAISTVLEEVIRFWGSERPGCPAHVGTHYIAHPDSLSCAVALSDEGALLGFQSLKCLKAGNAYDVPAGWGFIGTYVGLNVLRTGVGAALFSASAKVARSAGLAMIDATISDKNERALAYYEAMGFRTYRQGPGFVGKCYRVSEDPG